MSFSLVSIRPWQPLIYVLSLCCGFLRMLVLLPRTSPLLHPLVSFSFSSVISASVLELINSSYMLSQEYVPLLQNLL